LTTIFEQEIAEEAEKDDFKSQISNFKSLLPLLAPVGLVAA
jgi:hypothetical protein